MTFLLFYADPGSGMMLLQVLLAFGASLLFYFRKFFHKLFGNGKANDKFPAVKENVSDEVPGNKKEV